MVSDPIKNLVYRVKIIDEKLPQYFGKTVKVKFTGMLFRSLNDESKLLWIDQCEIIQEIKE